MTNNIGINDKRPKQADWYSLAARIANDGLWEWDLETNRLYLSPRWRAILGCHEIETGPGEWFSRVHPDDIKGLLSKVIAHLYHHIPYVEYEYRIVRRDGSLRWILCRGLAQRDATGRAYRIAGSQTDVTERKEHQWTIAQLHQNALQDTLTFLPNRTFFLKQLSQRFAQKPKEDSSFAVLLLDIDRFRVINNSLGPSISDQVLIGVARRMEEYISNTASIARTGNDEFAILVDQVVNPASIIELVDRVQSQLTVPFFVQEHEIFITSSIGIALCTSVYNHSEDLVRDADTALHRAKEMGGARYVFFDAVMHTVALEQLHLERDLRRALEQQEFCVYYQPIISLKFGKIVGFEALIRWNHPERGLLEPAEFIVLAEETGLINSLDRWVLREACQQLQKWQHQFPQYHSLSMSVNLSSKQFTQPDLVEYVGKTLRETGIAAHNLSLEITESVVMENTEHSINMLSGLQALHIQLDVDDFGTGYSSLSYLHRFPTSSLKIDRSFVSRIGLDSESAEIVQTIVRLGQILNMSIIAEGVETVEQLMYIRQLECCFAQGYFFSRPLDRQSVENLLASNPCW